MTKSFLVFQTIAFELVPANCKYYKENTCHPMSMFQQRVETVQISRTERFPNSVSDRVKK